jgi:hypothetical protein
MNKNKTAIKDWMGLSFYIGNDIFAWSLLSTVIPIPIRVPLYRKERLAGMFSAHSYYFSLWLGTHILTIWYPLIVSAGTFYFMGMKDESAANFWDWVLTSLLISVTGSSFGFMWGTFFNSDTQAVSSSIVFLLISALGAGQFINLGKTTTIVKIVSTITPLRYSVEKYFRRLLSNNDMWRPALLNLFAFNKGDDECLYVLIMFITFFCVLGWLVLIYKTSKL